MFLDESECKHNFIQDYNNLLMCEFCGLENNDNNLNYDIPRSVGYSLTKKIDDDLSKYLNNAETSDIIKKEIINIFEQLLQKKNLRGDGKRALLAACYFYSKLKSGSSITSRDIYQKFGIEKKKFNEGKHLLLTYYPNFRTITKKISDYIDSIFEKFQISTTKRDLIFKKCESINSKPDFDNYNPYSVCACIIFKELSFTGDIRVKKNIFVKEVGMSDVTVQKIMNSLI